MLVLFVGRMNKKLAILTKIALIETSSRKIHIFTTIVGDVGGESTTANVAERRTLNIKGVWGKTTQLRKNSKVYRQIVQHPWSMRLGINYRSLPKLQFRGFPMYHSKVTR